MDFPRPFCWACHRPAVACFCENVRPFKSEVEFALVVHPYEVRSTVGTAWILRRSISNLNWFRSKGTTLDSESNFVRLLTRPEIVPLLLFPGPNSLNLSRATQEQWDQLIPNNRKPLFVVIDGTWTQARAILRQSALLRSLSRVSFETLRASEYGFKTQPHPDCLSSVEGVHRVIEVLAERNWHKLPPQNEHNQMLEVFRHMVRFQAQHEGNIRQVSKRRSARYNLN